VAEQFLDRANIVSMLQKMCSKTVPECVTASCLMDFRALDCAFHCLLKVFLRDVVASRIAGARVGGNFCGIEPRRARSGMPEARALP
jgi:hypothetical protein